MRTELKSNLHYDYLIVGAGLFGAVFAHEMKLKGKKCYVIDKREHVGGNIYTKRIRDINVHWYGAHIFHTSNKDIWNYINQFAEFNNYINSPMAVYKDELYNMPFNMNTFSKMWGIRKPEEAKNIIEQQKKEFAVEEPSNLEEQALSLVGRDVYEKLVKGYTEKQWGRDCKDLPAFIIKRLPLRFTYNNNYFNDVYQGIPKGGYTQVAERLLEDIPVRCGISFQEYAKRGEEGTFTGADGCSFDNVVYTGMIDEYFDYCLGHLEYRALRFEHEEMPGISNYQGNAVFNYTQREAPYTRILEHKHFEFGTQPDTVVTREYSVEWKPGAEPYYPINDDKNETLYKQYKKLADKEQNVIFGGRLGQYRYYDMDKVIEAALALVQEL